MFRSESDPATLLPHLHEIQALADSEKEALAFLAAPAYREAIERRRLIAMFDATEAKRRVVGHVLFSGVFPYARIQQIVVAKDQRRSGIARALLNAVVSHLEARGYLAISAAVASDLTVAQAFYESCGFIARRSKAGGQARGRTIILRSRDLANESLFSILEPPAGTAPTAVDLGLQHRSASSAPLYVIDLNVLFDAIRNGRPRSPAAHRLVGAALGHRIRLAVAPEFVVELQRTTAEGAEDLLLSLARQLPRLPPLDATQTDALASLVHKIVFVDPGRSQAGSPQAISDARHIAEAALARASGYVTSDGSLLEAREDLLKQVGIDVASLEEFSELFVPIETALQDIAQLKGTDCAAGAVSVDAVREYLRQHRVAVELQREFVPADGPLGAWNARSIVEAGETVAIGVVRRPIAIDAPVRLLLHVRPDHVSCELFADHLLDMLCAEACGSGPTTLELAMVPGQAVLRRSATVRGFLPINHGDALIKVAIGRPITSESWPRVARQTRRRTGLRLPEEFPTVAAEQGSVRIQGPDGRTVVVRLAALEDALGPTVLAWAGRTGAIVPIVRAYADDLLGTTNQGSLFGSPEASFLTRRTYFNSPRSANLLRSGLPILFYESVRSGGRGAIVAAARIVDATVVQKNQVPEELLRRAVVEDVNPLSASTEVLATTFDNLLRFPRPVPLAELRILGATTAANFRSSTALSAEHLTAILELGWLSG